MALEGYGVLKGRPLELKLAENEAHLEIRICAKGEDYRIALNVRSMATPPELEYIIFKDFKHPFTQKLTGLAEGITLKEQNPEIGLDYIRGNLFDYHWMKTAHNIAKNDNEVLDTIQLYLEKAMNDQQALVYAFGQSWGPDNEEDTYFGFNPEQGIHDIHMNQGNAGKWVKDNGTYQDGGLLIHFPDEGENGRWIAIFLAFQSQWFHTDDKNGNPLLDVDDSDEQKILFVGAQLQPKEGKRSIMLLNRTDEDVNLANWAIEGGKRNRKKLQGTIKAGNILNIEIREGEIQFSDRGGILTLLNEDGVKIDGVSYSTPDYYKKGYMICFR